MQHMESKEVRYSEKAACGKGLDELMKCWPKGTPRNRNMITRNTDPLTIPIDSGLPRGHIIRALSLRLGGLPIWTIAVAIVLLGINLIISFSHLIKKMLQLTIWQKKTFTA